MATRISSFPKYLSLISGVSVEAGAVQASVRWLERIGRLERIVCKCSLKIDMMSPEFSCRSLSPAVEIAALETEMEKHDPGFRDFFFMDSKEYGGRVKLVGGSAN